MVRVFLGLGSNQGDRYANLMAALRLLGAEVTIIQVSSLYETEPVGYLEQGWFLNAVCEVATQKSPRQMLELANRVEQDLGRTREIRWGPRTVDIDVLLYDNLILNEPDLQIPHPRMLERAFVLVPLAEIGAAVVHPTARLSIGELAASLADQHEIRVWKGE